MICIAVRGNQAFVTKKPRLITSGTVGLPVVFSFDEIWTGLHKTAVFRCAGITRDVAGVQAQSRVPWEVLAESGFLEIGVYGTAADGTIAIPTIWAQVDRVFPGAAVSGTMSTDPPSPTWERLESLVQTKLTAPETAQVGQTVAVKTVDENGKPTAWEAVDLPDGGFYYPSLSAAMADINAGVRDNAVAKKDGKVRLFTAHTGILTAMLLEDVSEAARIDVEKSVDIALNGHALRFTEPAAHIHFGADTRCNIWGEAAGSAIVKELEGDITVYTAPRLMDTDAKLLTINGGDYRLAGSNGAGLVTLRVSDKAGCVRVSEAVITAENNSASLNSAAFALQNYGQDVTVDHCEIHGFAAAGLCHGIDQHGTASLDAAAITAESAGSLWGTARGIFNATAGTCRLQACRIFTDAPGSDPAAAHSVGAMNQGILHAMDSHITGTHCGISNFGRLYVDGGTLSGYSHGGISFSHGPQGEAFINDAALECGSYSGKYDPAAFSFGSLGAFYLGGSAGTAVYMDGCSIADSGADHLFIISGDGQTLSISGSTIPEGTAKQVCVAGVSTLNIGAGGNIRAENANEPASANTTGQLYRRKPEGSFSGGRDYEALLEAKLTAPETARVGQTVAVRAVDEKGRPAAWEAADLTKEWELFSSTTLEEEVSEFRVGNSYNDAVSDAFVQKKYREVAIKLDYFQPSSGSRKDLYVAVNNSSGGTYGRLVNILNTGAVSYLALTIRRITPTCHQVIASEGGTYASKCAIAYCQIRQDDEDQSLCKEPYICYVRIPQALGVGSVIRVYGR